MFPTDVIAQERIADRLRESERERLGRRPAEAKAFVRPGKGPCGTEPRRRHVRPCKAQTGRPFHLTPSGASGAPSPG
jgi:hypothetical protein